MLEPSEPKHADRYLDMRKPWLTIDDLTQRWALGKSTICKWVADGKLAKPTKFGRASRWPLETILNFEDAR
jgi:predicted DNA-binding transcriptional regulator AlpA